MKPFVVWKFQQFSIIAWNMWRVNSFLGCISLELFALFIGWFNMLLAVIVCIVSIVGIIIFAVEKSLLNFKLIRFLKLFLPTSFRCHCDSDVHSLCGCICFYDFHLQGVDQRRRNRKRSVINLSKLTSSCPLQRNPSEIKRFRRLWMVTSIVIALQILPLIARADKPPKPGDLPFKVSLLLITFSALLTFYFYICIDSLYKKLDEEKLIQYNTAPYPTNPFITSCQVCSCGYVPSRYPSFTC